MALVVLTREKVGIRTRVVPQILGTQPLATHLSFVVSHALRFLPQDSSILQLLEKLLCVELPYRTADRSSEARSPG
jgi:hypothetical protein